MGSNNILNPEMQNEFTIQSVETNSSEKITRARYIGNISMLIIAGLMSGAMATACLIDFIDSNGLNGWLDLTGVGAFGMMLLLDFRVALALRKNIMINITRKKNQKNRK